MCTKVSVRICCFYLLMACKDRLRMILQNIHNRVPDYTGPNLDCIMNPHHFEHLNTYQRILRTIKVWMEISEWENQITEEQYAFFTGAALNIMYFFNQLCAQCFIFCLSNKLRKHNLKYFLVINISSLDTHFRVKTQKINFRFTKMISQGESHTWNYLLCLMFSK